MREPIDNNRCKVRKAAWRLAAFLVFAVLYWIISCTTSQQQVSIASYSSYDNLDVGVPSSSDQIVEREGYALGWSSALKQPLWVQYRLEASEVASGVARRSNNFMFDQSVVGGSSFPGDYSKTGYDRGHLAPAADMHWSTNAMNDSFLMSNMSPQTPQLNRHVWASIEAFTRDQAKIEGSVIVVTGPIATNDAPKRIGKNKDIVVPDAFYKVVYDETPPCKIVAFIVPNESCLSQDIAAYVVAATNVEIAAKIDLFQVVCATNGQLKALKCHSSIAEWSR